MSAHRRLPRRTFLTSTLAVGATVAAPRVALALPSGSYRVQPQYRPTSTGGVAQGLIRKTPAYIESNGSGWWVCGHAALLSAINFMRQELVSESHKITQLQWVHDRLRELQPGYATSEHKEASIDALAKVVANYKSDEFAIRKISYMDRATVRDEMLRTLDVHSSYAIALTQIQIQGQIFGHFVAIHHIDYQPGTEQGGTVYYWDPYQAHLVSGGFADLLDGMRDAGAPGRFSFLRLFRR